MGVRFGGASVDTAGAPDWVRVALRIGQHGSGDDAAGIADRLAASKELAPLWDTLQSALAEMPAPPWDTPHARYVATLPGRLLFMPIQLPGLPQPSGARGLPWAVANTPAMQREQARDIAKLAKRLNTLASRFVPFDPWKLYQFAKPGEIASESEFDFLNRLPPLAGDGTSILLRVADWAARFRPASGPILRPKTRRAEATYLVRQLATIQTHTTQGVIDTPMPSAAYPFVAALANVVTQPEGGKEWTADSVRKCLQSAARSRQKI